jgi:hypothetical protein
MRRESVARRLHMGCGERLSGRLAAAHRPHPVGVRPVPARPNPAKAANGKR